MSSVWPGFSRYALQGGPHPDDVAPANRLTRVVNRDTGLVVAYLIDTPEKDAVVTLLQSDGQAGQ